VAGTGKDLFRRKSMMSRRLVAFGLMTLIAGAAPTWAQEPVRIGGVFPLTGPAASEGTALRDAAEVAADIINNPHPGLAALPLGAGAGLPGLGGRSCSAITRAARLPRRARSCA
jgi:branched-chain amino acid transport system substrate-binding protein